MSLSGQAAFLIGAAQGIGYACAEILLQNGVKVLISDINDEIGKKAEQTLQSKYGEGQVIFGHCDITNEDQVRGMVNICLKQFGRLDIFSPIAGIIEERENAWRKTIEINLIGVISSTYVVMKHMNKEDGGAGGVIVLMSSNCGLGPLVSAFPVYCASKHGVIGFMRDWADEHNNGTGVRIGALCPGPTNTSQLSEGVSRSLKPDLLHELTSNMPILEPNHVAEAFLRLVTEPDLHGKALTIAVVDGKPSISLSEHVPF